MNSLMYAVTHNNKENLINKIIDASVVLKYDFGIISKAIRSILKRAKLCIGVGCNNLEQLV